MKKFKYKSYRDRGMTGTYTIHTCRYEGEGYQEPFTFLHKLNSGEKLYYRFKGREV